MNQEYARPSILGKKIRPIVGNNSNEGKVRETLIFCIECSEPISAEFWQPEGYKCPNGHINPRAFIFYPTTKWEFRDDGELRHFSAGAILWRLEKRQEKQEKRYCLFRRRAHPIGYFTIPAGHLEMGEDPQLAAKREAFEETHLDILLVEPLYEGGLKRSVDEAQTIISGMRISASVLMSLS